MEIGSRHLGEASCRVSPTKQLPAHLREKVLEVSGVYVPAEHRGRGQATELMRALCDEADAAGVVLMLHAQPFGDGEATQGDLVRWYSGFGFQPIQPEPLLMARMVGATPRLFVKPIARAVEMLQ